MIIIETSAKRFNKFKLVIKNTAEQALFCLKKSNYCLSIYIVSDAEMRRLNKEFHGKAQVASVLSFQEPKHFPHPELKNKTAQFLGEIFIAPEYIQKQGQGFIFLVIHSILHLIGYTHTRKSDRIKMEKKEKKILEKIKFENKKKISYWNLYSNVCPI